MYLVNVIYYKIECCKYNIIVFYWIHIMECMYYCRIPQLHPHPPPPLVLGKTGEGVPCNVHCQFLNTMWTCDLCTFSSCWMGISEKYDECKI